MWTRQDMALQAVAQNTMSYGVQQIVHILQGSWISPGRGR
jgi:hypothetical protein